jgi:hypothetical protein
MSSVRYSTKASRPSLAYAFKAARTMFTFSSDIAYSESPAASS